MRAVIYGAKSTEDKHGSIPTQLADCRRMAKDWEVVGEYSDEGFSAYSGNRGPGLEEARSAAAAAAPSVLVVQHSDRLARGAGDAPGASQHLSEIIDWAIRNRVTIRTVQDDFYAESRTARLMAAAMGQRNFEDSERKSQSVKDGLGRRKDAGKPVGPVPLGYTVEKQVIEDKVVTKRVLDPATVGTVKRIFGLVEDGKSPGEIARILNAAAIKTRPRKDNPEGTAFIARTVRKIIENEAYAGRKGYPKIIDPERFDAIQAQRERLDPVQLAKRAGSRPGDPAFVLRGIGHCLRCGGTLYTTKRKVGRVYMCSHRRQATGVCDAPPIEATLIESHVMRHLDSFVGEVEQWLAEKVAQRDEQRQECAGAVDRMRRTLRDLDRQRQRHAAVYRKLTDEERSTAYIALEEVERIDAEISDTERQIAEGEALVAEWSGPPDVDAGLDFYNRLVDHVQARIRNADDAKELNEALGTVVAGLWAEIKGDRLLVEFELVGHPEAVLLDGQLFMADDHIESMGEAALTVHRPSLPPRRLDDTTGPARKTGTQTFLNRPLSQVQIPPLEVPIPTPIGGTR